MAQRHRHLRGTTLTMGVCRQRTVQGIELCAAGGRTVMADTGICRPGSSRTRRAECRARIVFQGHGEDGLMNSQFCPMILIGKAQGTGWEILRLWGRRRQWDARSPLQPAARQGPIRGVRHSGNQAVVGYAVLVWYLLP